VDPLAMLRAVVHDVRGDRGTQGGSTITQQLAKLNYTGSHHTVLRKLREVLYAARLERKYGKNELLERYLNQVYFGEGSYGLAAAAGAEFGTDPSRLTVAQAATLAAQIRGPSRLDPRRHPRGVLLRRDAVLRNMRRNGWIGDGQLRRALAEPL